MSAEDNKAMLQRFYAAFAARDGQAMSDCYHAKATFNDPVFTLSGPEVGAMWRMLCSRGKDLRIESSNLQATATHGSANWQAWYAFSSTGRSVHNIVASEFLFEDGKILAQTDRFGFWRWSRQALGTIGTLLGWSQLLRGKVSTTARKALDQYIASEANPR
ncbi:nuclear transport factor 2 family protein [Dokdonella sp.]|uniref:nuclear transport factor 2 family protein n=1 Tax=Dokdonella sp. TaxID=2291710 RepID=UPI003C57A528